MLRVFPDLIATGEDRLVQLLNRSLFHVRPELVPLNGSGDTSYGWAALWSYCLLAAAGAIIWSFLDQKRRNYTKLNYWFCLLIRYHVALVSLSYGISKLFLTQMPFPSVSELATPLGDLLPMRLAWMFIGYSAPYQFFSGLVECLAGLLLLWRRTATLGSLLAAAIFLNVAMLNLSYDVPVKIFSLELFGLSVFLLAMEWRRLACFFILQRDAPPCSIYERHIPGRWARAGRIAIKVAVLVTVIGGTLIDTAELSAYYNRNSTEILSPGIYDVESFRRNGIEVSGASRWQNLALDGKRSGSFKADHPAFSEIYGRRYFVYDVDAELNTVELRNYSDSLIATFRYTQQDSTHLALTGVKNNDTLQIVLVRSPHAFQLTERQFHWLSEQNR